MVLAKICVCTLYITLLVSAQQNVQYRVMARHQTHQENPFVDNLERIVIVDPDPANFFRSEKNLNLKNPHVSEVSENLRLFKKRNHGRIRMI